MNLSAKSKSWLFCLFCHILQPLFGLLVQVCPAKRLQNLTKNPTKSNFLDFADRFMDTVKFNLILFCLRKDG